MQSRDNESGDLAAVLPDKVMLAPEILEHLHINPLLGQKSCHVVDLGSVDESVLRRPCKDGQLSTSPSILEAGAESSRGRLVPGSLVFTKCRGNETGIVATEPLVETDQVKDARNTDDGDGKRCLRMGSEDIISHQ